MAVKYSTYRGFTIAEDGADFIVVGLGATFSSADKAHAAIDAYLDKPTELPALPVVEDQEQNDQQQRRSGRRI